MTYALVTGASKGIGRSIAEELAGRGFSLLLIARSEQKLQEESEKIRRQYNVQVHWLAMDLTEKGAAKTIFDWCIKNSFEVSILVNNAGYGLSGLFEKYDSEDHMNMMQLNMLVPVELCRLFLPTLKQQTHAYILNIASNAAYQAVPYMSVYAASKVFMLYFSRGLRQELRKSHVSVTCICPGPTDTDFVVRAQIGEKGLKTAKQVNMTSAQVGAIAVKAMLAGKAEVITGVLNKLTAFAVWLLPKGFIEKTAMKIYE